MFDSESGGNGAVGRWTARLLPWAVGLLSGVLALGPALGRGYVLRYDMVFVPDPSLMTVLRGADGFPRAIPSDAVVAVLSAALPGDVVQSAALLAVFAVGGAGAARLLLRALSRDGPASVGHALGSAAAGVAYVWNPFVAERLLLGQWAMLLGYAGLPWVVGVAARLSSVRSAKGFAGLVCAMVPAAVGGFSSVVLTALTAGPVALLPGRRVPSAPVHSTGGGAAPAGADVEGAPHGVRGGAPDGAPGGVTNPWGSAPGVSLGSSAPIEPSGDAGASGFSEPGGTAGNVRGKPLGNRWWTRAGLFVSVLAVVSLPWLLPSLVSGADTDPSGVEAFAARSDTPFGVLGSLLLLGGVWNSGAVPAGYGEPVLAGARLLVCLAALAGWVWWTCRARPGFGTGLSVAAATGFAIALLGVTAPGRDLLNALIGLWPGFGPLRDGQLYVAPLALVQALGFGAAVRWLTGPRTTRPRGGKSGTGPVADGAPVVSASVPGGRASDDPAPHDSEAGAEGPPALWRMGAAVFVVLLPVVALPGLLWGADGRLTPVEYPREWREAQSEVAADDRPGAVLVLPWGAYRGIDWSGEPVVTLDPATKLFDRRTVWNDDLVVGTPDGDAVVVAGEDTRAREVERILRPDPGTGMPERLDAELLGGLGVRYVAVSAPVNNQFWSGVEGLSVVVEGADMSLLRVQDQHIKADKADIPGLEVTGGLVTVGAIIWSMARSGSSLVFQRSGPSTGASARKEIPK